MVTVGLDRPRDDLGPAALPKDARAGERVRLQRGVLLEVEVMQEPGLADLWTETLVLAGLAAVLLTASVRSFRARLD